MIEKLLSYNPLLIEKKIEKSSNKILKQYGLEKIKNKDNSFSIPIPNKTLTTNELNELNDKLKWKPWNMSIISDEIASIFDDIDDNDNDNNINNTNNINISTNRIEESNYSQLIDYEEEFGISSDSFVRNEFI